MDVSQGPVQFSFCAGSRDRTYSKAYGARRAKAKATATHDSCIQKASCDIQHDIRFTSLRRILHDKLALFNDDPFPGFWTADLCSNLMGAGATAGANSRSSRQDLRYRLVE